MGHGFGFGFGFARAQVSRARFLLNKVPGASALYMPDRKLSSRIINGVRVLKDAGDPKPEADISPAQIANSELLTFLDGADGKTQILYDWSGNGNHATQSTVAEQPFIATAGVLEEGLRFAGGQWLDTGSETIGDGLFAGSDRRFSVGIWHKAISSGSLFARAGSTLSNQTFNFSLGTGGLVSGLNARGINSPLSGSLVAGTFYFNVFTWDGSLLRHYRNNVFNENLPVGTAAEETGQRAVIGARTNGTGNRFQNGNIAFVGIWDRALTPAEIATVYNLTDPRKSGQPWTPAKITTELWLDADDASTITLNDGNVSQWNDKSGNGRNATQTVAGNQPTYNATDSMVNNKPSIGNTTNIGDKGLITDSITLQQIYMVVYFKDGTVANFGTVNSTLVSGGGSFGTRRIHATLNTADFDSNATNVFVTGGVYKNGSEVSNYTVLPMPSTIFRFDASTPYAQTYAFLYNQTTSSRSWEGAVCEIIGINGLLSKEDRQKVEGYLAHKWGLTATLPADHPYKSSPPLA